MFPLRALVHQDLQRSHPLHLHVNEMLVRIQRMKQFFHGTTLPPPTDEVEAAWKEVPNQVLPLSLRAKSAFLEGPPPTPTQDVTVKDDSESIVYNRSQYDGPLHREDIDLPPPDEGLHHQEMSEDNHSLTRRNSPSRREFRLLVDRWASDYRARGTEQLANALLTSGIESPDSAALASRLAHSIIKEVRKTAKLEGENLRSTLRFSVLVAFKKHWEPNGAWLEVSSASTNDASLTLRGVNIAGLIGALFDAEILSAKDIHLCLSMLLEGNKHVDRLRAMHALLNHANDKLCKKRNRAALIEFRASVTAKGESEEFVWVTSPNSKAVIDDILAMIQRWMALQARKREPR